MSSTGIADTHLEPDDHRLHSLQRLMASRVRLRAALIPANSHRGSAAHAGADGSIASRARALWRLVMTRSTGGSVVSTAATLLSSWWVRQPWHATTALLSDAVGREVSPWVKRNPLTAVALGACAGAAIAMARPWRSELVHSQTRIMGRSAGRWMFSQLTTAPMQMALAAAVAAWLEQRQTPDAGVSPPDATADADARGAARPEASQAGNTPKV